MVKETEEEIERRKNKIQAERKTEGETEVRDVETGSWKRERSGVIRRR